MLTPYFELSQTDLEIILLIKAPLAKVAQSELMVEGSMVLFYSSPYYLRINLPGKVLEAPELSSQYDCDTSQFRFRLLKENAGEYFPDLDMIGKLLLPPKKYDVKPTVEVCEEVIAPSDQESNDEEEEDWYFEQTPQEEDVSLHGPKYGFANKTQGFGKELRSEFYEIFDIITVAQTPAHERSLLREAEEVSKFSDQHYLADLMEPDIIKEIRLMLEYIPPWDAHLFDTKKVEFSADEKEQLKNLGNRNYLLDSKEKRIALLSLVDILFGYAYNHRSTLGENSVESAWTINKLSSTLSWLQSFQDIKEVKRACIRRSLVYPLYRNWELTMAVLKDTVNIIRLGRRQILKCLLEIHRMFNLSEPRYLLNQLYITDYCIWLQKVSDKKLTKLVDSFEMIKVSKEDIGLDLEELETAALLVQEEELIEVNERLSRVVIGVPEESGSEDSDDSSSYSDISSEGDQSEINSDDFTSAEEFNE